MPRTSNSQSEDHSFQRLNMSYSVAVYSILPLRSSVLAPATHARLAIFLWPLKSIYPNYEASVIVLAARANDQRKGILTPRNSSLLPGRPRRVCVPAPAERYFGETAAC